MIDTTTETAPVLRRAWARMVASHVATCQVGAGCEFCAKYGHEADPAKFGAAR